MFYITNRDISFGLDRIFGTNKPMAFVRIQYLLPIFCTPFFVHFCPSKTFLSHFLSQKLLFVLFMPFCKLNLFAVRCWVLRGQIYSGKHHLLRLSFFLYASSFSVRCKWHCVFELPNYTSGCASTHSNCLGIIPR